MLESLAAGLHDLALAVKLLCARRAAVGALVGPPAPGIAVLPRLAPVLIIASARCAASMTRFGGLDVAGAAPCVATPVAVRRRGNPRPNAHLLRRPCSAICACKRRSELIALRLLAFARTFVRPTAGASISPAPPAQTARELPQMSAELAHRAMLREVARREQKRHILLRFLATAREENRRHRSAPCRRLDGAADRPPRGA